MTFALSISWMAYQNGLLQWRIQLGSRQTGLSVSRYGRARWRRAECHRSDPRAGNDDSGRRGTCGVSGRHPAAQEL